MYKILRIIWITYRQYTCPEFAKNWVLPSLIWLFCFNIIICFLIFPISSSSIIFISCSFSFPKFVSCFFFLCLLCTWWRNWRVSWHSLCVPVCMPILVALSYLEGLSSWWGNVLCTETSTILAVIGRDTYFPC